MARKSFVLLVVGTVVFFLCSFSSADVPSMINYQGKLTTAAGGCLNDTVQMTFSIYADSFGTSADWTETQDDVVVKEGVFSVLLGAVDTIPSTVFDGSIKYLGVQVESDPEMRPLKPMVSVAYAYRAGTADGGGGGWVDDGTVVRLADSTDQVGIGTSNPRPGYKLHLKDAPGVYLLFDHGRDTTWILGSSVPGNQSFYIGQQNPYGGISRLRIMTNGDTQLCPATGNVGIGTGSPTSNLHIREDKDDIVSVTIENRDTGNLSSERVTFWDENGGVAFIATTDDGYPTNPNRMVIANNRPGAAVTIQTQALTRLTVANDGNVGIGTTSPQGALDVSSTTGAFIVPRMTTAQRDALSAVNGMIIYNTTTNQFNFYENGAWVTK